MISSQNSIHNRKLSEGIRLFVSWSHCHQKQCQQPHLLIAISNIRQDAVMKKQSQQLHLLIVISNFHHSTRIIANIRCQDQCECWRWQRMNTYLCTERESSSKKKPGNLETAHRHSRYPQHQECEHNFLKHHHRQNPFNQIHPLAVDHPHTCFLASF